MTVTRYLWVLLLVIGCSIATKGKIEKLPEETSPFDDDYESVPVTGGGTVYAKSSVRYNLIAPTSYASALLRVQKFYEVLLNNESILKGQRFDYLKLDEKQIREKFKEDIGIIYIKTFTPQGLIQKARYKSTIAYGYKDTIYLKSDRLNRPECEVISTVAHETTHIYGFTHGGNKGYQPKSFPYWIGDKAQELCEKGTI